jgi:RHS repeat-associated protein
MRVVGDPVPGNNGVFYLLGDHLGGTNRIVNSSGVSIGELRYRAWGETRYTTGAVGTDYRYTGQRQEAGLGLYYYRARWYDPGLGRFTSPDNLGPTLGLSKSHDLYGYALGNPMKFIDPSGNVALCGVACEEENDYQWATLSRYGIKLKGSWTYNDIRTIRQEVSAIALKLATWCTSDACQGKIAADVFRGVFGSMTIELADDDEELGCWAGAGFTCHELTGGDLADEMQEGLVAHELGHVFDHSINGWGYGRAQLGSATITAGGVHVAGYDPGTGGFLRTTLGYRCIDFPCMQHPITLDDQGPTAGEDFADMFMNYTLGGFAEDAAGRARNYWMMTNMATWVNMAFGP